MFGDLGSPLNASSGLSASAELLIKSVKVTDQLFMDQSVEESVIINGPA